MSSKTNLGAIPVFEHLPDGEVVEISDGLVAIIQEANKVAAETFPEPRPGDHCESWYGDMCQFLGNGCPLEEPNAGIIDSLVPAATRGSAIARLKEILNEKTVCTKEDMSWAFSGVIQLEGFVKKLKERVKDWSRKNGPIDVGKGKYAWVTTPVTDVDRVAALKFMLDGMTIEEIAEVVSISKTNLDKKISKRDHPQIREMCLAMAVTEVDSNPKFEAIRED